MRPGRYLRNADAAAIIRRAVATTHAHEDALAAAISEGIARAADAAEAMAFVEAEIEQAIRALDALEVAVRAEIDAAAITVPESDDA